MGTERAGCTGSYLPVTRGDACDIMMLNAYVSTGENEIAPIYYAGSWDTCFSGAPWKEKWGVEHITPRL